MSYFVHPTAVVDLNASIGSGTKIWHFSHICDGAVVGSGCTLGQNTFVAGGVVLGNGCKVQNNVSLYAGVTCQEDVFLGPSMVFTNVLTPRAHVDRSAQYALTLVGRGATIGANATILCGSEIGAYAMVGAGAVVTANVEAHALVAGVPARQIGWVSMAGERLSFDETGIAICGYDGSVYKSKAGRVQAM